MILMLRKDNKRKFVKTGWWIFTQYIFSNGNSTVTYSDDDYKRCLENQNKAPTLVMIDESSNKRWWMYKNEFYWEDENYSKKEVNALIFEREHKKKKKINKAISLMSQEKIPNKNKREIVPEDVRLYVWNRDGGRCVKCGSQKKIEYDHIIPVSKGGSNTARNIQILCEECNRSKGDSLV